MGNKTHPSLNPQVSRPPTQNFLFVKKLSLRPHHPHALPVFGPSNKSCVCSAPASSLLGSAQPTRYPRGDWRLMKTNAGSVRRDLTQKDYYCKDPRCHRGRGHRGREKALTVRFAGVPRAQQKEFSCKEKRTQGREDPSVGSEMRGGGWKSRSEKVLP